MILEGCVGRGGLFFLFGLLFCFFLLVILLICLLEVRALCCSQLDMKNTLQLYYDTVENTSELKHLNV